MVLFVYFIGTEIYLRIFVRGKFRFWVTAVQRNTNDKISFLLKKRRSPNQQRER